MSCHCQNLRAYSDSTVLVWMTNDLNELAWIGQKGSPTRIAEWHVEIRELLAELHRRAVPLADKLIKTLRFNGIDPTPPPNYTVPNLSPVLVW